MKKFVKKILLSFIICIVCCGSLSAAPEPVEQHDYGCNCASLQVCFAVQCTPPLSILCSFPGYRKRALCDCKNGGMKHCKNWDQIIHEKGCGDLLKDASECE